MSLQVYRRDQIDEMVGELNQSFNRNSRILLLVDEPLNPKQAQLLQSIEGIVCFATREAEHFGGQFPPYVQGFIEDPANVEEMQQAALSAEKMIALQFENQILRFQMQSQTERLQLLMDTALEISEEKEPAQLYQKVLSSMRQLTYCEGASLYLVDSLRKDHLRFTSVQNEKVDCEFREFLLPIDETSMAGAAASRQDIILVPDVAAIPMDSPFQFNRSFDKKTGYQTRSTLNIPLAKSKGDLVGVIQLINSKRRGGFSSEDQDISKTISCHIAAALEAVILYKDIENLFEGIIKASVKAIESRDPNTSGHSERVGRMAVAFAEAVSSSQSPEFVKISYTPEQIREIRYAATLHDFGKIGVPEEVLLKAKKLYPHQFEILQMRLEILKLAFPERRVEFEKLAHQIENLNEPTVQKEGVSVDLSSYVGQSLSVHGREVAILTAEEWRALSLPKGTLTSEDRQAVESHVLHSVNFLKEIPWTADLSMIPEIVLRHHETLDGTGYPYQVCEDQIPFETQMISIVDIFDALTAKDRSYKKAVPIEKTLEILESMAKDRKLNLALVQLFKDEKVYMAR